MRFSLTAKCLNAETVHVDSDANPTGELVRFRDLPGNGTREFHKTRS